MRSPAGLAASVSGADKVATSIPPDAAPRLTAGLLLEAEMPYLIGHQEDCAIVKRGILSISQSQTIGDQRAVGSPRPTPCTCGGLLVSVPVWTPSTTGIAELDFPTGSPA